MSHLLRAFKKALKTSKTLLEMVVEHHYDFNRVLHRTRPFRSTERNALKTKYSKKRGAFMKQLMNETTTHYTACLLYPFRETWMLDLITERMKEVKRIASEIVQMVPQVKAKLCNQC